MEIQITRKLLLFFFLLLITHVSVANKYYVAASGNDMNAGMSPSSAWQTMAKVESVMDMINPGDSIVFRKGDSFKGTIFWTKSGLQDKPITFTSYGNGKNPVFEYAGPGKSVTTRGEFYFQNTSYIIIDGFTITDAAIATDPAKLADKTMQAYLGYAISFIGTPATPCRYCTIKNCDISLVGMGIALEYGNKNTISNNRIYNLKNVKNTCSDTAPGNYDDFGANGITLSGDENLITNNYFNGNWATSCDFGFNGGAIEMFHSSSGNRFLYNTVIDCNGFMEIGSDNGGVANNNLIAYNLLINNGMLTYVNIEGPFAIQAGNIQYYNNTIIDVSNRFRDTCLFNFNGVPNAATVFSLKNNIFYLSSGIDVVLKKTNAAKFTHDNNVYHLTDGSTLNLTANTHESITTAAIFTNTTGEPTAWDYTLAPNSSAINAGQWLNLTKDFNGKNVVNTPDAGMCESDTPGAAAPSDDSASTPSLHYDSTTTIKEDATDDDDGIPLWSILAILIPVIFFALYHTVKRLKQSRSHRRSR